MPAWPLVSPLARLGSPVVVGLVMLSTALAAPPAETTDQPAPQLGQAAPHRGVLSFEHHGGFRFRPELLLNADLGAGASPVPAPLQAEGDESRDTLAWASIRLRYEPTLRIGSSLSVHLGIDALDNLVLGESFAGAGGAFSDGLTSQRDTALVPSAGQTGHRDAVRVRQLYGTALLFDALDFSVGRMPQSFGLGITRNDGSCEDCEFGTLTDAMRAGFTISGFRLEGSWEFTASGATTATPEQPFGQASDLGQDDDLSTYTIQIGQRPFTDAERREHLQRLDVEREWVVSWSLFSAFTDQELSSLEQIDESSIECQADQVNSDGTPALDYDCIQLFERQAFFWRPGAWVRAEWRPDFLTRLRIEAELQGVVGEVRNPQRLEEADDGEAKDFVGFGGAVELEYTHGTLSTGLDMGFATGDNADFVGVLDGQNIVEPDDDAYQQNDNVRGNKTVTSFFFNRDYRLDLLLFRQILGAVTNAVYVKPWVAKDLLQMEGATLNARVDVLYAAAVRPSGTPGDGDHWGVEIDGQLALTLDSGLYAGLTLGVLKPLDALDNPTTGEGGDIVFGMRGLVGWQF